jgi:hypothetical protein
LIVVALGAWAAWSAFASLAAERSGESEETVPARERFMATGGLVLCAWFAVVIVATEIPAVLLMPCTP